MMSAVIKIEKISRFDKATPLVMKRTIQIIQQFVFLIFVLD
jgi:hypothetical protein